MKILIIKMSSLGDVVHTLPLVELIKKGMPDAEIDWVVNEEYTGLLKGNPNISDVLPFKRKEWLNMHGFFRNILAVKKFAMGLKKKHYDLVIDVQGLFKSALVVLMASGKKVIGFADAREFASSFYDVKVAGDPGLHAVERYLLLAKQLNISWQRSELGFYVPVSTADIAAVNTLLAEHSLEGKRLAIFCPFSRWGTKMWEEKNFHELEALINQKGLEIVWTGAENEKPGKSVDHDFTGRLTINQLYYLMKKADFVVTCDSGAMHVAAAADAHIFALFGPTSDEKTGPYVINGRAVVIRREDISCAPCFSRDCPRQKACMDIKPEEVFKKIEETVKI